jgi:phage shock protein PspC (stress-responsive transcriptional regulator)
MQNYQYYSILENEVRIGKSIEKKIFRSIMKKIYLIAVIIIPKENVAFEEIKYKKFYRIKSNHLLGGVCTGLESYFSVDVVLFRILFIGSIFLGGIGLLLYLLLWIITPEKKLKPLLTK